jgi:catechol 2,3-dioxygenase-like lactoylglutathione lyase family enzyme
MFSHVHVGITNFERSYAFYAAVMKALGFELRIHKPQESWAGWAAPGNKRPLFFIGLPYDRQPASSGNGGMTAFLASTREAVDRCHQVALETGGRSEGAPGLRPHYHPDYYGAYFRDPDGNKICVCCHEPATTPLR